MQLNPELFFHVLLMYDKQEELTNTFTVKFELCFTVLKFLVYYDKKTRCFESWIVLKS